jgi:hypothetical protein
LKRFSTIFVMTFPSSHRDFNLGKQIHSSSVSNESPRAVAGSRWILLGCLLLWGGGIARAATDVSGTLSANTTWTAADSPVRVTGHLTVAEGVTLTVQPGVRIQVLQHQGVYIQGHVQAVGTAAQPILFEGSTAQPGWWRGLQVTGTGSAHIEHAEVAHGGYWDSVNLVKTGTGALTLRQVTIRDGTQDGLRIGLGSASFVTENNRFERNNTAVRVQLGCPFEDVTSSFNGNGTDVLMEGGTLVGTAAWRLSPAYSMLLNGHLTVGSTGQLTVGAGTRIKPSQHAGIYVDGRLVVAGTAGQPVVFTDRRDDSVGGDANRDGDETQPDRNWWRGIQVREEGQAQLTHTTVRYTGYWDSVGIRKLGSGNLTLDEVTVEHGAGDGVRLENSTGETVLTGCVLRHNGQNGLRLQSGTVTATGCRFEENDGHGVRQTANDHLVYAANEFGGTRWAVWESRAAP